MKITNQTNIGWVIINGSGWNHHKTADALEAMLAEAPDSLPIVPTGYAILVAPISDKPFGLRCALVKALPRRIMPSINIYSAEGGHVQFPASKQYDHIRLAYIEDMASAESLLAANGYAKSGGKFINADGTSADIEMIDDGCEGEADGWASDIFGCDVEKIYSVKAE